MTPHKHRDLIIAWANGAQIQFKNSFNEWRDLKNNAPSWEPSLKYRIKPEPPAPKYRPFTYEEAKTQLLGKTVISKTGEQMNIVSSVTTSYTMGTTYENMLEQFMFLDGTPCGVLE